MSDIQEINEKNMKFIKNSIDIKEIKDYKDTYNIELLYYIPFLSNNSNIDIYNISNINTLNYKNIISKNGIINKNETIDNDLITNINGYYIFENSSSQKDLYYINNYALNTITIENNANINSFKYMKNDNWYNFMFLFSTDTLSARTIAILNNSVILSINENQKLSVSINLVNIDYNELYTISLQSQSSLKANRPTQIAIVREQYMGRYKFSLFINGVQSDIQITELDYNELNLVDQSNIIYGNENSIQTLFWFHEDSGIETYIDEIYLFGVSLTSSYFPIPTNYTILPLPADISITNNTKYNYTLYNKKYFDSVRFTIINKKINFNLRKELIYHNYTFTKKNIINNILSKYTLYRNIRLLNTKKYYLKIKNLIIITMTINLEKIIKKIIRNKNIIIKRILKNIQIINKTNRYIRYKNTKVLYLSSRKVLNIKKQRHNVSKYICKNIKTTTFIHTSITKNTIIKNKTNKFYVHSIKRLNLLYRNILKIMFIKFNTCNNSYNNITIISNLHSKNVINIYNKNKIKRVIYYLAKLYSKTKFKNGDIDVYYSSTCRRIALSQIFVFDNMQISRTSISVENINNIIRKVNYDNINTNNLVRLIISKKININNTVFRNIIRDLWLNNTNKKIKKIIISKFSTLRECKPRYLIWAFVMRTD